MGDTRNPECGVPAHQLLCWPEQEPVSYTETCAVPDAASIEATLLPPSLPSGLKASGLSQPPQSPPMVTDGTCNKYLPNTSTEDRFIWVMRCDVRHPSGNLAHARHDLLSEVFWCHN